MSGVQYLLLLTDATYKVAQCSWTDYITILYLHQTRVVYIDHIMITTSLPLLGTVAVKITCVYWSIEQCKIVKIKTLLKLRKMPFAGQLAKIVPLSAKIVMGLTK